MTTPFAIRLDACEAQKRYKAQLCANVTREPGKLAKFSKGQYQAAVKTVRLALALFSAEENLTFEQVELCHDEVITASISMRIMWESLPSTTEGEIAEYKEINRETNQKIKELCLTSISLIYQQLRSGGAHLPETHPLSASAL